MKAEKRRDPFIFRKRSNGEIGSEGEVMQKKPKEETVGDKERQTIYLGRMKSDNTPDLFFIIIISLFFTYYECIRDVFIFVS